MRPLSWCVSCLALVAVSFLPQASFADEFQGTIQKIDRGTMSFVPRASDAEGNGQGRRRMRGSQAVTLPIAVDVQVTTAHHTRRTGDFFVGTPVGGGLQNSAVRQLKPGVMARVVTDGKKVIEINIVFSDEDGNTVVAVSPKPAPKK